MPASLQGVGDVEVYLWAWDLILPFLKKCPEAMWEIPLLLMSIMRQAREIICGLGFQPVAGRWARCLVKNVRDPENKTLEREMTSVDMAAVLATSPEVDFRLLYQFQADRVIVITRPHITVKDQ
jgi:hypothetical protein